MFLSVALFLNPPANIIRSFKLKLLEYGKIPGILTSPDISKY